MQKHKKMKQPCTLYALMPNQLLGRSCILNAHLLAVCRAALVLGKLMFTMSKRRMVG